MTTAAVQLDLLTPPVETSTDSEREAIVLEERLRRLGLSSDTAVRTHANRTVLLNWHPRRGLRIHRGYAHAPDDVLRAIVRYLKPGVRRADRRALHQIFIRFPVHLHVPPDRARRVPSEPSRPGDADILVRLRDLHARLNARRFGGALGPVRFRLSGKMRTRLGEFGPDPDAPDEAPIIGISRLHLRRDGWAAVEHTVLHEMVHQWQAQRGLPLDHGTEFRTKAREVGATTHPHNPAGEPRLPQARPPR